MKRHYQTLVAVACLLSACADRWPGGGRLQELPSDERMQEAPSGSLTDGGASSAGAPSDGGAGASVGGSGGTGVGGLGFNESAGAPPGLGTAGTGGTGGSGGSGGIPGTP